MDSIEEFVVQCYEAFPLSMDANIPKAKDIRKEVAGIPECVVNKFWTRFRRQKEKAQISEWAKANSRKI